MIEHYVKYYSLEDMHKIKAETGSFPVLNAAEQELQNAVMGELDRRGLDIYHTTEETLKIVEEQRKLLNLKKNTREADLKKIEEIAVQQINAVFRTTAPSKHKTNAKNAIMQLAISEYDVSGKIMNPVQMRQIAAGFRVLGVQDDGHQIIEDKIKKDTTLSVDPIELKNKVKSEYDEIAQNLSNFNNTSPSAVIDSLIKKYKDQIKMEQDRVNYPYKQVPFRSTLMPNVTTFRGLNAPVGQLNMPMTNLWLRCRDNRGNDCYWNSQALQDPFRNKIVDGQIHAIRQPQPHDLTKPVNVQHIANAGPLNCPPNHVITRFIINPENKLMQADCQKSNISPHYAEYIKKTSSIINSSNKMNHDRTHHLDRFYFNCPNGTALNSIVPNYNPQNDVLEFQYKCIN